MESTPEFFRNAVKKFKAADALLSSQLKLHHDAASAEQADMIKNSSVADRAATAYMQAIEKMDSAPENYPDINITPQIDSEIATLKNLMTAVWAHNEEIIRINGQIEDKKDDLKKALLWEKTDRVRKNIWRVGLAATAVGVAVAFHFWLLTRTTLSFTVLVDGQSPPAGKTPVVTLDEKPFASQDKIKLGHHHLSIELPNHESVQREFWTFYESKNLGSLALESYKGSVSLFSAPTDSEFELSGNGRHWQGKLPMLIDSMPVGTYKLIARRKGWEIDRELTVSRGTVTTNQTEFQYGSIEVTSDPTGLAISTSGVEVGKTPITLSELKPGQYSLTASDGENDLMADVSIAPKEASKQAFVFHYGTAQLLSSPTGATVIRKGKELGKTPLTLKHILADDTMVELRLQDYKATNLPITVVADVVTTFSVKLTSERYLQAMEQAREAFDKAQYKESGEFIATALELEPKDSAAIALRSVVEDARKEADQKEVVATIEKAIAAVGGRDVISRFKSVKSVYHVSGKADGSDFSMHSTVYAQLPDTIRLDEEANNSPKKIGPLTLTVNGGRPIQATFCINRNTSWKVVPGVLGSVQLPLDKAVQSELITSLYLAEIMTLVPLLGADYSLEKVPDAPFMPSNSVAIKVLKTDKPAVTLYFDKDRGFLIWLQSDKIDNHGNLVHFAEHFSDYQDYSGLMYPMTTTYKQDANTFNTAITESFSPFTQYYGNVFTEPPRQQ